MENQTGDSIFTTVAGSIGGGSIMAIVAQTILLSAIGAAIGAIVGFAVNRQLNKWFPKKKNDDN